MKRSLFETLLGALVLLTAIIFIVYGYNAKQLKKIEKTYSVSTFFNNAGGLKSGADVRISGVVVGKVKRVILDNDNFKARVDIKISQDIALPTDTVVEIASDGFIGGKYIRLNTGNETTIIPKDGVLNNSKDVVTLEQMIGKFIFLTTQ